MKRLHHAFPASFVFTALALSAALFLVTLTQAKPTTQAAVLPAAPDGKSLDTSSLLKAMGTELRRSMDSLVLRDGPRPYFLSYLLWDMESYQMQASLGSVEISAFDKQHSLDLDLRVGDYTLDNSNFRGGLVFGPRLRLPLPQENDANLVRLALWAATDARYKVAVEQLARKRAFLANHSGKDTLPDFSRSAPLSQVQGDRPSPPDTAGLTALGRELSRYLSGYPWLSESRVGYQYYYTTFYYVDSEGNRYIQTFLEHTLIVSLLTQAEDGAPLWDYVRISSRDPLDISKQGEAGLATVEAALQPVLRRMEYLRSAAPLPNYRGPVLFTGTAAGELLNKALLAPQARLREPVGIPSDPNFMLSLDGRKLFPSDITVTDSPSKSEFRGRSLYGHYPFDHQGQPARDIVLVKDGRVTDFYQGRVPILKASGHAGNGHWRYGGGFPGVAQLQSSRPVGETELASRLAALGLDEGTGYGLIVTKGMDEDAFKLLRHPLASHLIGDAAGDGRGSFSLSPPCEIDRLDSRTGVVTPVRGLTFPALDSKSLRDIAAVGDEPHIYEPQAAFTALCPSLLFTLLDLQGGRGAQPRLPYLP